MLSREEIDFFHAHGFLVMRGVFQDDELRLLTEAVNRTQAQGEAREGDNHLYMRGPQGEPVYWRSERMWRRESIFRAVTVKPELLENIGQCIGEAFYPWNDSLVVKLARQGAEVHWHQDPPYGNPARETTFGVPNFTTDIYLDYSGPDNGCVYAIPGHHLVGHVDLAGKTHADFLTKHNAQPLEMQPGDALFHALSTPHGSAPNLSDRQRRIFYIHYLADSVFQDGYGVLKEEWVKQKPGWGAERLTLVEEMIAARRDLGWDDYREAGTLTLGEGGFTFTGTPNTPPHYWDRLSEALSTEERARKKSLSG